MSEGILRGIRVVELSCGLAGPLAARLLAEHGADVIKVEPPDGDLLRGTPGFASWNRSKRGMVLDLTTDQDRHELDALLADADVLIHGLRPSTAARLGLDDRSLAARFPRLVPAAVVGYPVDHPDAERDGYDILVQARSGAMDEVVGTREGPIFLRFPLPSWPAVYLAVIGIVTRLVVRDRSGRAGPAHTSLRQGLAAMLTMLWNRAENPSEALAAKVPLPRHEHGMALSMFQCADGEWLQTLLGYTEHPLVIETLAEMGEVPIIVEGFRPGEHELQLFRNAFQRRPRDEWLAAFYDSGVPAAPLSAVGELLSDPEVLANGYTVELRDPDWGRVRQATCAYRTQPPPAVTGPAPMLGEHNGARFHPRATECAPVQGDYPAHRPLEGLKVLDFGMYVAGPFAGALLADLGADVIKVEPPGGDRMRPLEMLFLGYGRGRRSIAVDLADPASRPVIERLVRWADVVHHNLRQSAAKRLLIDEPTLRGTNKDVIYCHVSAYGDEGARADWPSYDATAQAMSGWPRESVAPDARPMNYRYGMFDPLTAMASTAAVLLTLYGRARGTCTGSSVTTSLLAAVTESNSETMLLLDSDTLAPIPRIDAEQTGVSAGYRIYPVSSGRWIAIAALHERTRAALREVAGVQDDGGLGPALARREAEPLLKELDEAGVPAELVRTDYEHASFDEEAGPGGLALALHHPHYGRVELPGRFWSFGDLESASSRPAPLLGQHTDEVLRELGFDEDAIRELAASGLIRVNDASA